MEFPLVVLERGLPVMADAVIQSKSKESPPAHRPKKLTLSFN